MGQTDDKNDRKFFAFGFFDTANRNKPLGLFSL